MKKRLIINFRTEDLFGGCQPKPIDYGTVDGAASALVEASPGVSCLMCSAWSRCKKNYIIVDNKLPSEISRFSNS